MQMFCGVLIFNVANGDCFDDYVYYDGVVVGGKYGGLGWYCVVCGCNICVGDIANLWKEMICGVVAEFVRIIAIYERLILGGIGGVGIEIGWCKDSVAQGLMVFGLTVMFLVLTYNLT